MPQSRFQEKMIQALKLAAGATKTSIRDLRAWPIEGTIKRSIASSAFMPLVEKCHAVCASSTSLCVHAAKPLSPCYYLLFALQIISAIQNVVYNDWELMESIWHHAFRSVELLLLLVLSCKLHQHSQGRPWKLALRSFARHLVASNLAVD